MTDYRPTIEQIISKADSIAGIPMTDEESQDWYDRTVERNKAQTRRERGEPPLQGKKRGD